MHRLLALTILLAVSLSLPAQDDDPKVPKTNIPASQLLAILRTDKDVKMRRAAVSGLELIGSGYRPGVVAVATTLKEDADAAVREAAATALGKLGQKAQDLVKEKDKRDRAIETRDVALDALRHAVKSDKAGAVREAAAVAIGRAGTASGTEPEATLFAAFRLSVPTLVDALKDPQAGVRAAAAEALGRMGSHAREATAALVDTFKDRAADKAVRGYAAMALGRVAVDDSRDAVEALAKAILDSTTPPEVRRSAAEALGALKAEAAAGPLGQALKDSNVAVRRAAAASLGQIGPEARVALAQVKEAVRDDDKFVRAQAVYVLGGLPNEAAETVPLLVAAMKDRLLEVQLAAVEALGRLGPAAKPAEEALKAAARSAQKDIRAAAEEALKKVAP